MLFSFTLLAERSAEVVLLSLCLCLYLSLCLSLSLSDAQVEQGHIIIKVCSKGGGGDPLNVLEALIVK